MPQKKPVTAQKKTTRRKKKAQSDLDLGAFVEAVEGTRKKSEAPVTVIPFNDVNVVGHGAGLIPTGSLALDKATGVGGWPRGRIIEISGAESVGKTTTVTHAIAATQALGGLALIVDTEEKMDEAYTRALGVDVERLMILQSRRKTFESIFDAIARAAEFWIDSGLQEKPLGIFWDSVGSTPTASDFDRDSDEAAVVGRAQKLLKGAMRTLPQRLAHSRALLMAVNHLYTNIQTGYAARFGSRKITYGGMALRYATTLRVELVRTGWLKRNDGVQVGVDVLAKVHKNNVAAPAGNQRLAIRWGMGFDDPTTIFWRLQEHRYITVGGSWYTYQDAGDVTRKWQGGAEGFLTLCLEDPEFYGHVRKIYEERL